MIDDVINGGGLIDMNYPKIGPHSPELIESAGSALYELVRFLKLRDTRGILGEFLAVQEPRLPGVREPARYGRVAAAALRPACAMVR